jgi:hypothetical protein
MPIKAGYLLLAGGGGVFVWSGIAGKSVSSVFRQLAGGDSPTTATGANPITGDAALSASSSVDVAGAGGSSPSSSPSSSPGNSSPTASETAWFTALLAALGAPATNANLQSLANWAEKEEPGWSGSGEGGVTNNPLNHGADPSQPATKGTESVGPGIPEYSTVGEGVKATADYLEMGNYSAILAALKAGKGLATGDAGVESELSLWSGGGYNSV